MKKQKLSLEELKVQSFVTEIGGDENALGGSTPVISIVAVTLLLCFPEEANVSADSCGLPPADDKPIIIDPGKPILNDTGVPGPCNSNPICIA